MWRWGIERLMSQGVWPRDEIVGLCWGVCGVVSRFHAEDDGILDSRMLPSALRCWRLWRGGIGRLMW